MTESDKTVQKQFFHWLLKLKIKLICKLHPHWYICSKNIIIVENIMS